MLSGLFVMNAVSLILLTTYDNDVAVLASELERIQYGGRVNLLLLLVICITLTMTVGGAIVDTWVVHYLHTPDATSDCTRRQHVHVILTTNKHVYHLIAQSVFIHIVYSILQITITVFWMWVLEQSSDTSRYIAIAGVCVLGGKLLSAGLHLVVALCQRQSDILSPSRCFIKIWDGGIRFCKIAGLY
jgi:mannose/fructose/N-acetylgalactosamine-specific phosphotransferase system component IID